MSETYAYGVARTHIRESNLLTRQDVEQLFAAATYEEAVQLLGDKGYTGDTGKMESLMDARREDLWKFIDELSVAQDEFKILRYETDFHNLKVSVKAQIGDADPEEFFLAYGNVPAQEIWTAVKERKFELLPSFLSEPGKNALEFLLRTQDGQGCDMYLDRTTLETISKAGEESAIPLIREYARWKTASTNIKIAVRCCLTEKTADFIQKALAPCAELDCRRLSLAASKDMEPIYEYLGYTDYAGSVDALKISLSAFEKWCDNRLMERILPEKTKSFGLGPIIAYVLAVENEIKMVRLILSGKLNHLDENLIRERMRELYE